LSILHVGIDTEQKVLTAIRYKQVKSQQNLGNVSHFIEKGNGII
jgi:hypothetical protein